MSITDELRAWAKQHKGWHLFDMQLAAIADRIDAEHEKAVRERRRSCIYYDPERHYCSCHDFDVSGYVELPKDADGEYIRVGERVQLIGNDPSTVSHMSLADDGWRVYVKYDGGIGTGSGEPKRIRHHHAPTVEDVLTEFGIDWEHESDCEDRAALLKEYAAKLRLAEEDAC